MDGALKQEIIDLTKAILETFTKEYIKAYTIQLTKKAIKEAKQEPSPYQLDKRPKDFDKSDIFSGYLTKLGAIRKNWLKRHFVVRYDYTIDYFVDDTHTAKKGSMSLSGYSVVEDPNKSGLERIFKVAKMMGMDTNSVPKPKELPPFTIELYHSSRRIYHIQASSEEEFKEWVEMFKTCCRKSSGFKNSDLVHVAAFKIAVRNTKWSLGRWGWFSGGTENQILTDVITEEIEYDILGRCLSGLPAAPWFIRNYLRGKMMTVIEGMVSSAVNPAWIAMDKTVTELRPTMEPRIKNQVDPIAQAQKNVQNKMRESIMSVIEPPMQEHVVKHLKKILSSVRQPIADGYDESLNIWNKNTGEYNGNGSEQSFASYRRYPNSYWTMYPAKNKVSDLYSIIEEYRNAIFQGFSSYFICYDIKESINDMAYDGAYTFEKTVTADQVQIQSAVNQTQSKYQHDVHVGTELQMKFLVREMVKPTLSKIINPLTKPILNNLSNIIPSAMSDFLDINDMYNQLVDEVIDDTTQIVLDELNEN